MIEQDKAQASFESLRSFDFQYFKPEHLNLPNWEAVVLEENMRWLFKHNLYHTKKNSFAFEVYKAPLLGKISVGPELDLNSVNRVSVIIGSPSSAEDAGGIIEVRKYATGVRNNIPVARFEALRGGWLEIEDGGSFKGDKLRREFKIHTKSSGQGKTR